MCMQDIDIDRQIKTNVYFTTGTLRIPPNGRRLSVLISCQDTDIAELRATGFPIQGTATALNPLLGFSIRNVAGVLGLSDQLLPSDLVTLERVGEILKGDLVLLSLVAVGVWAIETYLDVVSPVPDNVTRLSV